MGNTTIFTLTFSTTLNENVASRALINNRFNVIVAQMVAAGVPAANTQMNPTVNWGSAPATMGGNVNLTTFTSQQVQAVTPATQTTTNRGS